MIKEFFLLDNNIYRGLSRSMKLQDIPHKALEFCKAEWKIGMQSICSIIVAIEMISHLGKNDPEREECFKALCLLRYHTFSSELHKRRVVAYPMEDVLTFFFLNKNFIHFDNYNEIIRLMELLTIDLDISVCDRYFVAIQEVNDKRRVFRERLVLQAKNMLIESGLDWDSFTQPKISRDKILKAYNLKRLEAFQKGEGIGPIAKLLIDLTYTSAGIPNYSIPAKDKLGNYLKIFQAPLRMYNLLMKKIGEAPTIQNYNAERWNTVNDMHLLFNVCDPRFDNLLMVTEDKEIIACMQTTDGMESKVGKLADYFSLIGI
jgi:hypothetical protein